MTHNEWEIWQSLRQSMSNKTNSTTCKFMVYQIIQYTSNKLKSYYYWAVVFEVIRDLIVTKMECLNLLGLDTTANNMLSFFSYFDCLWKEHKKFVLEIYFFIVMPVPPASSIFHLSFSSTYFIWWTRSLFPQKLPYKFNSRRH